MSKGVDPIGDAAAMVRITNGARKVVVELRLGGPVPLDLPFLMASPNGPVHLSCRVLPGGIVEGSGPPAATPTPGLPPEAPPTVLRVPPGPPAEAGTELPLDPKWSGSLPSRGTILAWVIGTALAILLVVALPADATFAVFMVPFIGLHVVVVAGFVYGNDRWSHEGLDLFQRRRILRGGVEADATVVSERQADRQGGPARGPGGPVTTAPPARSGSQAPQRAAEPSCAPTSPFPVSRSSVPCGALRPRRCSPRKRLVPWYLRRDPAFS